MSSRVFIVGEHQRVWTADGLDIPQSECECFSLCVAGCQCQCGCGFHELPTNVSEFPWVELEGAQVSVEVEVSEVEAPAAGLLHFLLLSLARNKAL